MKVLVLGVTRPIGEHAAKQALEHGDTVTALVRKPEVIAGLANRITVIPGDATSVDDMTKGLEGQDSLIAALGRGTSMRAENLFSDAATALVEAARKTGVRRVVWLSSHGVGDTYASASLVQKLIYRTITRNLNANKAVSEEILRAGGLDLTIVYPTSLKNGPAIGAYKVGDDLPMKGNPAINRADVGHFMHNVAHDDAWINRSAVITG